MWETLAPALSTEWRSLRYGATATSPGMKATVSFHGEETLVLLAFKLS